MNEWSWLEERRELFILKGKSNHSDLSRKLQHRSPKLPAQWENTVHVGSPVGLLAYRRNSRRSLGLPAAGTSGSRDFRLPSGLSTDMMSQATKSQGVGTSDIRNSRLPLRLLTGEDS